MDVGQQHTILYKGKTGSYTKDWRSGIEERGHELVGGDLVRREADHFSRDKSGRGTYLRHKQSLTLANHTSPVTKENQPNLKNKEIMKQVEATASNGREKQEEPPRRFIPWR